MIYIAINTKGGVAKSTTSSQVLANYLYGKNKQATRLIEIDDENKDSYTFSESKVINCEVIPTTKLSTIDDIFYDNEDVIIDVGGNKTATIFLNNLKKVGVFDKVIFFIPLTNGQQDNLNALETYENIKSIDSKANVIFVLSKVLTDDLEFEFLHFFGHEFLDTDMAIMKQVKDAKYFTVNNSVVVGHTRTFNKTIKDIAMNETDFKELAINEKDKTKRRKLIFLNRVKNDAIEYVKYLDVVNTKIDELIKKK